MTQKYPEKRGIAQWFGTRKLQSNAWKETICEKKWWE